MRRQFTSLLLLLALAAQRGSLCVAGDGSGGSGSLAPSAWLPWVDCTFDKSAVAKPRNFDCMTLQVPVCHGDVAVPCTSNGTLPLMVMRRQTNKNAAGTPTVWLMTASPGLGQTADLIERIARQQGGAAINVYAMETRHSKPPISEACGTLAVKYGTLKTIDRNMLDTAAKCSQWITATFGTNGMSALSLDSAARDLATGLQRVHERELKTNPNVYLFAVGGASRVAQRLMATSSVSDIGFAGFIFDTPHTMKLLPTQDEIVGNATSLFLDGCESDTLCRAHYANLSMSLRDVLKWAENAVDALSDNQSECIRLLKNVSYVEARDLKPSHGLRRYIVGMRQRMSALRVTAPLLYRAHRCQDTRAFEKLLQKVDQLHDGLPLVPPAVSSMGHFVDRVVAYSEMWPLPVPSRDQLANSVDASLLTDGALLLQQPSYCLYQASNSSTCTGFYKRNAAVNASRALVYATPIQPSDSVVDATTGFIASLSGDALILASRINTMASSVASEQLYDMFQRGGSNSTIVFVQSDNPASTEVESDDGDMLLRVVGQFVARKAKPLSGKWHIRDLATDSSSLVSVVNTSTVPSAPVRVNFTLTESQAALLRSAIGDDPYEEPVTEFSICSDCEAKERAAMRTFVIIACVATGLVLVWMAWFSWCRTKKKPATTATASATVASAPTALPHNAYYQPYQPHQSHPYN